MSDTPPTSTQPDAALTSAASPEPSKATEPGKAPGTKPDVKADPWKDYKPPEGFTIEAVKPLIEWAQKAGLDPKAAAAVMIRDRELEQANEAEFKHLSEKGWLEELQKDPQLGGEKIRETMVDVMRAVDKLPPKVQAVIKDAGVLYNPVVVRILHAFGTGLKEDTMVRPGTTPAPGEKKSLDERLQSIWAK